MKKAIVLITSFVVAASIGAGGWFLSLFYNPNKYNLITLDTSSVPFPVEEEAQEYDIQLSEVKMHYAIYGDGEQSVILIHGNGGSHKGLESAALYLANDYTVYAIDSRCQGESSDPGEITYDLMADDVAEFIEALNLDKPYVMGHSDGAIVALALGIRHPELPGAIISCGANSKPSALKSSFTLGVIIDNYYEPDKLNDLMLKYPHFTKKDLAKITAPTYIVAGEYDIMRLHDTVYMYKSIKNSKIAIIENGDHCSYISNDGAQAYVLAKGFLDNL
jgi:pimeloyl-ACP methyl ester carboxylesterase